MKTIRYFILIPEEAIIMVIVINPLLEDIDAILSSILLSTDNNK